MQSQSLLIQFKGHVVKKLFRYFIFVILIGGVFMVLRVLIRAVLIIGIFAGILFTAAGRLDWAEAWTLIGLYAISLLGMMLWGAVHAPDLMRERSMIAKNVKGWDRVINKAYGLAFGALLIVAGLDAGRFGWSIAPSIIHWIGGTGCAVAGYIVWLTIKENAYLSRWARIQDDRGQKVVSTGPYRVVRHPMYAAILLFVVSTPLLLGSWWALIPAGVVMTLYILRTRLEDNMLHDELEGYGEYAKTVPFRLFPGVW